MEEILKFLQDSGTFYLATADAEGNPHVRPFGAVCAYAGKLYLITANTKAVYAQLMAHPALEISSMTADGRWIRLNADARRDESRAAKAAMLEANPNLRAMYSEDDGKMEVFALDNGKAQICSFTAAPVEIAF